MGQYREFFRASLSLLLLILIISSIGVVRVKAEDVTFEYVGSELWAGINDIETQGNHAYCTTPFGLLVLDLSNPSSPVEVGRLYLHGNAKGLGIDGNYACVASDQGMHVIDISNPESPAWVSLWAETTDCHDALVLGSYVYLMDWTYFLRIVDISNPAVPILSDMSESISQYHDMCFSGDYAYGTVNVSRLGVLDISDPSTIVSVGSGSNGLIGHLLGVAVAGNVAYAAARHHGLTIFDISDPAAPQSITTLGTPGWAYDVAVVGNHAYVANQDGGLAIMDVTNPSVPALIDTYQPDSRYDPDIVQAWNGYLLTNGSFPNLSVLDPASPTNPALHGQYGSNGEVHSVTVVGDVAYVGDDLWTVHAMDISDPAVPAEFSNQSFQSFGDVRQIEVQGNYMYAALDLGVAVHDLTDPEISFWHGLEGQYVASIAVSGDLLVAYTGTALYFYDISSSLSPVLLTTPVDLFGGDGGIDISGDHLYVGGYSHGIIGDVGDIQILDISDPSAPESVGTYVTPGAAWDVTVEGDLAYVTDSYSGLHVVDVSDPSAPVQLGICFAPYAEDVQVSGQIAYLSSDYFTQGVYLVDVSSPANPTEIGFYPTIHPNETAIDGDMVYLADTDGFLAFQVTLPTGACCPSEGVCLIATKIHCESDLGGTYASGATECLGDINEDGFDDACVSWTCCEGRVGDANGLGGDEPTIGDVSVMIDAKFIAGRCDGVIDCLTEADLNQSGGRYPDCSDHITIGDISILIDYLFITGSQLPLPDCL